MTKFQQFFIGLLASIGFITLVFFCLIGLGCAHPVLATQPNPEPTQEMIQQAEIRYIEVNGNIPKDLTEEQENYMKNYINGIKK
ncbi:hypothetical protein [Pasteurella bettyae]|uniref:hypothetical protein n=1 Tax=Pasteurella bettyae TaxID=752 RepID=UPI003D2A65AC